mmetsp:Transcript_22391/g.32012  ORF Transcript_22391/g.32012 Transcript_22391/m.32012 type:complete len:469 (-) Transcript_22391:2092-3498(-)
MSNQESSDGEDAEERYFIPHFFQEEWDGVDGRLHEDEDDDSEVEDDDDFIDLNDDAIMREIPPAHELDGEMVNWYARNHERYIKNIINNEPVEDYGLSIPQVAAAAAAGNNDIDNNNAGEAQMAENNLRLILSLGPTFGDSPLGRGVSCELKSGVVMPYNRSFMPLWLNYTDALRDCRVLRLFEEFSIYKIHLHRSVSSLMFSALQGKHIKKLTLSETNLCGAGFASLAEYLGSNTTLQQLTLDKNRIDELVDTEQFGKALRKHPQLEYLSLSECSIGNNVSALSDILHSGIKSLGLGCNEIGSQGGFIIASYLTSNPPMESISLERNQLNDTDVIYFANSLKTNTRLSQLTLSANKFTLVGVKLLFNEIFNPTTLNDVVDCNHTCTLHLFTKFFNPIQRVNGCSIDQPPSLIAAENKRNKILLALRIADSQLHYFEGVPLEMMPFVLTQIQQDEVITNKLTREFFNA